MPTYEKIRLYKKKAGTICLDLLPATRTVYALSCPAQVCLGQLP